MIEYKLNEKKFTFSSYDGFFHPLLSFLMFLLGFMNNLYFNSSCCLFTLLIDEKHGFNNFIENKGLFVIIFFHHFLQF